MKLLKTAVLLALLSSCALAQNLNVKIIQRQYVKVKYEPTWWQHQTVTGATLTLQLPDGRVAVVTCTDKPQFNTPTGKRSCRIPPGDEIEAEFKGDDAKLTWSVRDNEKHQSETYKVLAVDPAH